MRMGTGCLAASGTTGSAYCINYLAYSGFPANIYKKNCIIEVESVRMFGIDETTNKRQQAVRLMESHLLITTQSKTEPA